MALPCQPPMGSTLHSIFSDDVQGTYGTDWIAFFYSPDTGYSAIDPHNQYHVPLGGTGF